MGFRNSIQGQKEYELQMVSQIMTDMMQMGIAHDITQQPIQGGIQSQMIAGGISATVNNSGTNSQEIDSTHQRYEGRLNKDQKSNGKKSKKIESKIPVGRAAKTNRQNTRFRPILPKPVESNPIRSTAIYPNVIVPQQQKSGILMNEDYIDSLRRAEDTDMGLFTHFRNVAVSDGTGRNITTEDILSTDACNKRPVTIGVDAVKTTVVKPVSQEELRQLRTRYFANKKKRKLQKKTHANLQEHSFLHHNWKNLT